MDYFEIRKVIEEYIKEKGVRVGLQNILYMLYGIIGGMRNGD